MLPDDEINALVDAVFTAVDLARAGDMAAGYEVLLLGLGCAEQLRADGVSYGAELANRYWDALDRFGARHGVGHA